MSFLRCCSQGLRMNRTLLSLSLCNNQVSDQGAQKLAEVRYHTSPFKGQSRLQMTSGLVKVYSDSRRSCWKAQASHICLWSQISKCKPYEWRKQTFEFNLFRSSHFLGAKDPTHGIGQEAFAAHTRDRQRGSPPKLRRFVISSSMSFQCHFITHTLNFSFPFEDRVFANILIARS